MPPLRTVYARSAALSPPRSGQLQCRHSVFKRKPTPGLLRGGFVKKTRQIKNLESRFDSIETEETLGMIEQVKVRQQLHGEIAAKPSVAVAAVTTDSGHLDRALIELDVVGLMSLGC